MRLDFILQHYACTTEPPEAARKKVKEHREQTPRMLYSVSIGDSPASCGRRSGGHECSGGDRSSLSSPRKPQRDARWQSNVCHSGHSSAPAWALKMYLVPDVRRSATTVRLSRTGWIVCQVPPGCSRISSSHTHCFGSCMTPQAISSRSLYAHCMPRRPQCMHESMHAQNLICLHLSGWRGAWCQQKDMPTYLLWERIVTSWLHC
jgi:hypothetical protein